MPNLGPNALSPQAYLVDLLRFCSLSVTVGGQPLGPDRLETALALPRGALLERATHTEEGGACLLARAHAEVLAAYAEARRLPAPGSADQQTLFGAQFDAARAAVERLLGGLGTSAAALRQLRAVPADQKRRRAWALGLADTSDLIWLIDQVEILPTFQGSPPLSGWISA